MIIFFNYIFSYLYKISIDNSYHLYIYAVDIGYQLYISSNDNSYQLWGVIY